MDKLNDEMLEFSVLASAIINNHHCNVLMDYDDSIFISPKNILLFNVIKQLHNKNVEIDIMAIRSAIIESDIYEKLGGDIYYAELLQSTTIINYDYAIDCLCDYRDKRCLIKLSEKLKKEAYSSSSVQEIIEDSQNAINNILSHSKTEYFTDLDKTQYTDIKADNEHIKTGVFELDGILGGFFGSQLIILGSRTRIGKSLFALQIAKHVAQHRRVLFYSLEMSVKSILWRLYAMETGAYVQDIKLNRIPQPEMEKQFEIIKNRYKYLSINDNSYHIRDILVSSRKRIERENIGLIIVDYLQLVDSGIIADKRIQIGEITRKLKLFSMKYNLPILCISQLNRVTENEMPTLSDLSESSNIEKDSDVVILLHRKYTEDKTKMIIAKNRDGFTKTFPMRFDKHKLQYITADEEEIPARKLKDSKSPKETKELLGGVYG